MSHAIGRLVPVGPIRIGTDGPGLSLDFVPAPATGGGDPRFVILHFTSMAFAPGARLEVDLGYGVDVFDGASGPDAWTRPIDPKPGPISIRYLGGGPGGVTLAEYGSGEPTESGTPGAPFGSRTNPDVFLHTDPYDEPTYETRLRCGVFDWQNAACAAAGSVQEQVARAVGMFVVVHAGHLSSCTGTLIEPDLVLTAQHCLNDPSGLDVRSGSITFDYQTTCPGAKPGGYAPRFHKMKRIVRRGAGDWVIFQIETPPGGLGIAPRPLRASAPMVGESVFAIHHPNSAVKKLQSGALSASGLAPHVGFDYAGGSSGSALFDAAGSIVGAALSVGPAPDACSVVYVSSRAVLNELATPPAPPAPFDVMVVIDRSGSMAAAGTTAPGATKMSEARDAASLFVQLVRRAAGHRLGMVAFSTSATRPPNTPLAAVDDLQKLALVGPAPYTGGSIGALTPDAMTSIGDGLRAAMESLTPASTNRRGIVLLTDGLQNTPPMVEDVEGTLGDTRLCVLGFGDEASLDGPLLTRVARAHDGLYTRARHGLELKKFFGLCFGDIFESGMLADPEHVLAQNDGESEAVRFSVCEEAQITAILGWSDPTQVLRLSLTTPGGAAVTAATPGVESDRGLSWQFLRVVLPHGGERAGAWSWRVSRDLGGGEFPPPAPAVRYFVSVIAAGGPRLVPVLRRRRVYTGDPISPQVALRYPEGTAPHATVEVTIERPDAALGALVTSAGLAPPRLDGDPVGAFRATLQRLASAPGGLALPTRTVTVPLVDDGAHDDGAMEPDGVYGNRLEDLTRFEGTYTFHAKARFGDSCVADREAFWSLSVEPAVDPTRTDVRVVATAPGRGTIVLTPRDPYGNPLGPGRGDLFEIAPQPGTTTTGPVVDRGGGSYGIDVTWTSTAPGPGVVLTQPERPPVPLAPPGAGRGCAVWLAVALGILLVVALLVILWLLGS